jgi:ATP-dependent helicase/nuclease subunit A
MSDQLRLFGGDAGPSGTTPLPEPPDGDDRRAAVDPRENVVLEASAGTGKTSVLVARYLNLLRAGVDPANVLAITFTRKAATEMRERIVAELRRASDSSAADRRRWIELRDRLGEIGIQTIDAFCLSLLREFPLEADLDPGFEMADETEVPRIVEQALDGALRIAIAAARDDADLALVLAELGTPRVRTGLAHLLARRLVARDALDRYLARGPRELTAALACRHALGRVQDALRSLPDGLERWLADGPVRHPRFRLLAATLGSLPRMFEAPPAAIRTALDRVRAHFLTLEGRPRQGRIPPYTRDDCLTPHGWRRHREAMIGVAPGVAEALAGFDRDLNVVLARGVRRLFEIARAQYRRALEERSRLDFTDLLERALALLGQMDEFAQSRFRLESRYHHVLVDEFQDTSQAQWELVALLIRSWGEGFGLVHDAPLEPTVFVVGDRKQSIYRFRDADPQVLDSAARFIENLRPQGRSRRTIQHSFRALPELLAFVNDVFREVEKSDRPDAFRFAATDEFPLPPPVARAGEPVVGVAVANDPDASAAVVADEIVRLLAESTVRDRQTGTARAARPGDMAILFRSRASHREFERALDLRHVPAYVYKGLGFFDTDEIKDLAALLRYLADPSSDLRTAALLRSRMFRLSDDALAAIAPRLADALMAPEPPASAETLATDDHKVIERARRSVQDWLPLVDIVPPADLLDLILAESAYAFELRGSRRLQAWENVKKMRTLARRIQNRGYATMARIADYVESLHAGDESNAVLEAIDAVHLMTIHAAKGLEFPIVFVVNLAKGTGGSRSPVRITVDTPSGEPEVAVGTYQSPASDDESARDREETKRLLYVALTRARDRVYLSSVLKDGVFDPARGSLAEVVPASFGGVIARAGSSDAPSVVEWTSTAGRVYPVRACRPRAQVAT